MLGRLAFILLPGAALGAVIGTTLLARLGPPAGRGVELTALLSALVVFYVVALVAARRLFPPARPGPSVWSPVWILFFGLLMRLPLAVSPPTLSDDIYRYVWDGRVSASGENPFRYAPLDPALADLRDPAWQKINNPDLHTIYPPAAQGLFALGAVVAPGVTGLKILILGVELLLALLIALGPARRAGNLWKLILYWWHPLPVIEFAGSGHIDALGVLFLTAGVMIAGGASGAERALGIRGLLRGVAVGICLAASAMVKFLVLPAAPFLAGRRWLAAGAATIAIVAVCYLPLLAPGVDPFGSLGTYAAKWRANDFVFGLLQRAGDLQDQDARLTEAKLFAAAFLAGVVIVVALLRVSAPAAAATVIGVSILISPTVHPWYLAWILPMLCLQFSAAWFYITLAALLAYHPLPAYLAGGGWNESAWLKGLALIPFLGLAVLDLRRFFRR